MIEVRPFNQLGGADHGWLKAKHHFSFAELPRPRTHALGQAARLERRRDRAEVGLSAPSARQHGDHHLCPRGRHHPRGHHGQQGPHRGGRRPGDVGGTGVNHAEFNLENETTRLFQIWILPTQAGGAPSWGAKPFPKADRSGRFVTLASGFADDKDALPIRTEARVLGATVKAGERLKLTIAPNHHAYLVSAKGAVDVNGVRIDARDGAAIENEKEIEISGLEDAEIVLVETA